MSRTLLVLFLLFGLTGCVSDMMQTAVDAAGNEVRLKWAEEWKPALLAEMKDTVKDSKELVVTEMSAQFETYRASTNGKLEQIGVTVENFDRNQDGVISGAETLELLQDIKAKNESNGSPLSWWEIVMALAVGYVPVTSAKELLKKKFASTPPTV